VGFWTRLKGEGPGKASADHPRLQGDASRPGYREYLETICQENPQVFVELSSICNFQCFYCESPNHNRKSQMDDATFQKVLEQLPQLTTQPIRLHCDGEPTVHAKFFEYAKAINDRGMRINLVSNGSNLQERFLALKMDIGIHLSTSPEEFDLRSKLPFDRYLSGMLNYLRTWLRTPATEQNIQYNVYLTANQRESKSEMERITVFATEFLASAGLDANIGESVPNSNWYTHRKRNRYKFRLSARNIASGGMYPEVEEKRPVTLPRNFGFCDSAWKRLVVLSDGSLQPCCLDLKGTLAYTKPEELAEKTLRELWHEDPRIIAIRKEALRGEITHPTCQKCLDRLPDREFYTAFARKFETSTVSAAEKASTAK